MERETEETKEYSEHWNKKTNYWRKRKEKEKKKQPTQITETKTK